ncbi:MAG: hypothetical protein JEY99_06800 [Spirochaetales bacterium]|nr:hypothetical protein [Spirochaetales bacterium]
MNNEYNKFQEKDIPATKPAETIGLAATINDGGLPHISLLTSLQAISAEKITAGEFCKGISKANMEKNRKTGFLIMTLNKEFWSGSALWYKKETHGPEYEEYNTLPMFRYNSYFGINTVHYMDLISLIQKRSLPMGAIIGSALKTRAAAGLFRNNRENRILNPFSENLINKIDSLCFLSFINNEGYPKIIPIIQSTGIHGNSIIFNSSPFAEELNEILPGTETAIFCMNLQMESVLLRGIFSGYKKTVFGRTGKVDLKWVYNSMPPGHRQIYPETELTAVSQF